MIVYGYPIPLAVFNLMDILPQAQNPATVRLVAAGYQLKQRGFTGSVRPHDSHNGWFFNRKIGFQLKGHLSVHPPTSVDLVQIFDNQQW
jgi:hypothetical protein